MNAQNSPEQLLALLQVAIDTAPQFKYGTPFTENEIKWLGRAEAILKSTKNNIALHDFRTAHKRLNTYSHDRAKLLIPMYTVLSELELQVPEAMQGAYIPPGDTWNGYSSLIKIVQSECNDMLIVDPYLNSDIYEYFAPHSAANNGLRCLTSKNNQNHYGIIASKNKWDNDQFSTRHKVEFKYACKGGLHDRLIILNRKEVWLVSQSFKDIAKRSPASVTKANNELGLAKAEYYETLWENSTEIDQL